MCQATASRRTSKSPSRPPALPRATLLEGRRRRPWPPRAAASWRGAPRRRCTRRSAAGSPPASS
uniref:Uncharacterized protein n=1 Tax=Arundo donax TaxID=35708 RepID=A0A0A9DV94_ARUDO